MLKSGFIIGTLVGFSAFSQAVLAAKCETVEFSNQHYQKIIQFGVGTTAKDEENGILYTLLKNRSFVKIEAEQAQTVGMAVQPTSTRDKRACKAVGKPQMM